MTETVVPIDLISIPTHPDINETVKKFIAYLREVIDILMKTDKGYVKDENNQILHGEFFFLM